MDKGIGKRKLITSRFLYKYGLDLSYFDFDDEKYRYYTTQCPKTGMVYKGDYLKILSSLINNRGFLKENPTTPFILPNY